MSRPIASGTLSYSARLLKPFVAVLEGDPRVPAEALAFLRAADPDDRFPVATVHALLEGAEQATGDASLGVKASLCIEPGDLGVLDYLMTTAASLEASLQTQIRSSRLLSDALDVSLVDAGDRTEVRIQNRVMLPRAAAEYQICAMVWQRRRVWPANVAPDLDVYVPFAEPSDRALYEKALGSSRVHVNAPFTGFSFDARHLSSPMPSPDPKLHDLLRKQLARVLEELPRAESMTDRVRGLLGPELASGNPSTERIARVLHMSVSTLSRRLADEGTTFSEVLDELRKHVSLEQMARSEMNIVDVALLTGFSQGAAFHRAFKRWTGETPAQYRRQRQRRSRL